MLQKINFEENKEYRAVRKKLLFHFLRKFYSDDNLGKYFSIVFFFDFISLKIGIFRVENIYPNKISNF